MNQVSTRLGSRDYLTPGMAAVALLITVAALLIATAPAAVAHQQCVAQQVANVARNVSAHEGWYNTQELTIRTTGDYTVYGRHCYSYGRHRMYYHAQGQYNWIYANEATCSYESRDTIPSGDGHYCELTWRVAREYVYKNRTYAYAVQTHADGHNYEYDNAWNPHCYSFKGSPPPTSFVHAANCS